MNRRKFAARRSEKPARSGQNFAMRNSVGGGVGISRLLKTRNLQKTLHAKNAEIAKIAPSWNVSGTRLFRKLNLFLALRRISELGGRMSRRTFGTSLRNPRI